MLRHYWYGTNQKKALRFNRICQATTSYSSENIKEELQWYPTRNMLIQPLTLQNLLEHYSDGLILAVMMVLHAVGCVYVACFLYEWCKSMSILLFTRNFSLQTAVCSRLLVGWQQATVVSNLVTSKECNMTSRVQLLVMIKEHNSAMNWDD